MRRIRFLPATDGARPVYITYRPNLINANYAGQEPFAIHADTMPIARVDDQLACFGNKVAVRGHAFVVLSAGIVASGNPYLYPDGDGDNNGDLDTIHAPETIPVSLKLAVRSSLDFPSRI